jgi:hypothetical protein
MTWKDASVLWVHIPLIDYMEQVLDWIPDESVFFSLI